MFFHWNNEREGKFPSNGRAWWHFESSYCNGRTICFEWNLWSHSCGVGFDVDDEDLTLQIALPPLALYLSFGMHFWLLRRWPRPDTMVIDQRECSVKIFDGKLWIHPWSKTMEWVKADPWWVRGVTLSLNPFEWKHRSTEVWTGRDWEPFVGSWEHDKTPDSRQTWTFPYRYVLRDGTVQDRTATVYMERMKWRPRCLRWTRLFERTRKYLDVSFSDEAGERTGSWKGGMIGCSYDLRPSETPEQCLKRMESERVFA